MQYARYIKGVTDYYKAITLKQPEADMIAKGERTEIVRKDYSGYRGEVLIVSSPIPKGERTGMIVGKAELYEVEVTPGGNVYKFRNASRMIEFPCQKREMKGVVWDCFYTKNTLAEYPKINLRKWIGSER